MPAAPAKRCVPCVAIAALVVAAGTAPLASCGGGAGDDDTAATARAPVVPVVPVAETRTLITTTEGRQIKVTSGAAPGYVPDEECAACHEAIAASYRHVSMSRAFYAPDVDHLIEDIEKNDFYHAPSHRHYEMFVKGGALVQRRYQLDDEGNEINAIEEQVDWIVGSGTHVRTYLYQTEAGTVFQMPVSWYTQNGSWGMSPGYDRPRHRDFARPITRECMFCHNAYPEAPAGSDEPGRPAVFPKDLPHGLGCQRCHGPGAEHVRLAYDLDSSRRDLKESIVAVSDLEPRLQTDVCLQCHLQPSSEVTTRVGRPGRRDYSYRPGQSLDDFLVVLDFTHPGEADEERFDINHHPYRLFQSRCHIESGGALKCTTCHNPHRKVPSEERLAHYRSACLTCHVQDDCTIAAMALAAAPGDGHDGPDMSGGGDCARCHMPQRRTQDVVQIVMTDHKIVKDIGPEADRLAPLAERGRPEGMTFHPYWDDRGPHEDEFDVYRGISLAIDGDTSGVEPFAAALGDPANAPAESVYHLARAYAQAGQAVDAAETLRTLLAREPDYAPAHWLIAQAIAPLGEMPTGLKHLERAVELEPQWTQAWFALGIARATLRQTEGAAEAYERAILLDPNHVGALSNLGHAYLGLGRLDEAIARYRRAVAVDPGRPESYVDLGLALARKGDLAESLRYLRHGTRVADASPALAETYACALVLSGWYDEALVAAGDAETAGADAANCELIRAVALRASDRTDEAVGALARAREQEGSQRPLAPHSRDVRALLRAQSERADPG